MNNSIKFTKEKGRIQILIKKVEDKKIKITVKDDGIGIEISKLEII